MSILAGGRLKSPYTVGIWLAVLAATGFSFKAILVKLAYALPAPIPLEAVTLLALRMVFALPAFIWVGLRESRNAAPLARRDWLFIVVLGLLGYYGASIFDFIGLRYITAGLERLILFTYPTLTVLIGVLFLGHRLSRRELAALGLCYAGIAAAFAHDLQLSHDDTAVWIGAAFIFASSLSYALYLVGGGQMIARLGAARFTALAMLASTAATLLHFLLTQPLSALDQPWQIYALALAMALFSTVLPVFAQSAAVHRIGAGRAALVGTVGPLLTIFFAWRLLGESISTAQIAGAALVVAGVLLVSRRST
ncbi:MAG: DMT family transporter [Betaproteobacteria bacterium]|nr:DMT family transporter [Betaproteobacteria bacterium]